VLVGTHLERAYQLRAELGPPDRAARRLAEDAGRRLGAAGIRASQREDGPAAVNLLGRACRLLPESDRGRLAFLCELGTAFKWVLDDTQSGSALEEASRLAEQACERGLQLRAELERAWPGFVQGRITADQMLDVAGESIRVFEPQNDNRGLSRAWHLRAAVALLRYQWATCADAAERALAHYELAHYPTGGCLSMLAAAVAQGPAPVTVAIPHCEELATRATSDSSGRSSVLMFVALLEAMRGRTTAARKVLRDARELAESRGVFLTHDWTSVAASIESLAGDHGRAEAILRPVCVELENTGDVAWLATFLTKLAEAVYAQGRHGEALELAGRAEAIAPPDDVLAQTGWRQIAARGRARTGSYQEGERLAREAVRLLEKTDALSERGSALVDLAEVLILASRHDEAAVLIDQAVAILSAKGNTQGIDQALARLAGLRSVAPV
jgi:tetratricopeptide (TPR) repeat protein